MAAVRLSHRLKNNNFAITNTLARRTAAAAAAAVHATDAYRRPTIQCSMFLLLGDKNIQQCSSLVVEACVAKVSTSIVSRMSNLFWQLLHLPFAVFVFLFRFSYSIHSTVRRPFRPLFPSHFYWEFLLFSSHPSLSFSSSCVPWCVCAFLCRSAFISRVLTE